MSLRLLAATSVSVATLLAGQFPALAVAQSPLQPLVIGVDHADPANQQPQNGRVFEYTDFFSRDVRVHSGYTVDFRWAPGAFHVIALAPSEGAARAAYPVGFLDSEDTHLAPGTGFPKIQLGPSNGPITAGSIKGGGTIGGPNDLPACGITALGQKPCTFAGGNDVEVSGGIAGFVPPSPSNPNGGGPAPVDWLMQITAGPGDYDYFCTIHPGMRGKLHVVGTEEPTTSQADVDAVSAQQFQADQMLGLQAEQAANRARADTDSTGVRTWHVSVGVAAADNHVAIDEMLPRTLRITRGDQVEFKWRDGHNVHTVSFAQSTSQLPEPFGFDCGTTFGSPPAPDNPSPPAFGPCYEAGAQTPEAIFDPGTTLSGYLLGSPTQVLDSGVLIGSDYGLQPTTQTWSVRTDRSTQTGTYQYVCTVHDWMTGTVQL